VLHNIIYYSILKIFYYMPYISFIKGQSFNLNLVRLFGREAKRDGKAGRYCAVQMCWCRGDKAAHAG
jgi:hypothetical protein